jgi:hypothetical protein
VLLKKGVLFWGTKKDVLVEKGVLLERGVLSSKGVLSFKGVLIEHTLPLLDRCVTEHTFYVHCVMLSTPWCVL